jgi:hypothetical protein
VKLSLPDMASATIAEEWGCQQQFVLTRHDLSNLQQKLQKPHDHHLLQEPCEPACITASYATSHACLVCAVQHLQCSTNK